MKRIVLGLSGGVDSAVAARLLQKDGWEVCGLYLDIGGASAREDALRTADFLGVTLKVQDIGRELEQNVCAPFACGYLQGQTPNPCILCNPAVKFKNLIAYADELGAQMVATGHYARTQNGALYKGKPANDQSYMLCRLKKEQVARTVFPLGEFEKTHTRALAQELGIPVANKPDSMEICFIPDKDYIGWLSRRETMPPPGDFVFHGQVLGRHEGIHRYTVGQRRPGLYEGRKLYISRICPEDNRVELALWEELFTDHVRAREVNWLIDEPREPLTASVKVRHTKWECPPCVVRADGAGGMDIHVTEGSLRAPARGQSAVLYDGARLLAGGFII